PVERTTTAREARICEFDRSEQWPGSFNDPKQNSLRYRDDGLPDAGYGWLRSHRPDSYESERPKVHLHNRIDRARADRRSGQVHRRRDGRLYYQAGRARKSFGHARTLAIAADRQLT